MRIRDPGGKKFRSGIRDGKIRIRDPKWKKFGPGIRDGKISDQGSATGLSYPGGCVDGASAEGGRNGEGARAGAKHLAEAQGHHLLGCLHFLRPCHHHNF
jgi:hypothetical protein